MVRHSLMKDQNVIACARSSLSETWLNEETTYLYTCMNGVNMNHLWTKRTVFQSKRWFFRRMSLQKKLSVVRFLTSVCIVRQQAN